MNNLSNQTYGFILRADSELSTFLEVLSFFAERKAHRQRSGVDMRIIDTMS